MIVLFDLINYYILISPILPSYPSTVEMSHHSNSTDCSSENEYDDIIFTYSHWSRDALIRILESKYNIIEDLYDKLDKKEEIINNISRENNEKASKATKSSKSHTVSTLQIFL